MASEIEQDKFVYLLTWYLGDDAYQEQIICPTREHDAAWMAQFVQDTKDAMHPEVKLRVAALQVRTIEYITPENPQPLEEVI